MADISNPYDYMLHIRENKVLFQYMEVCGVQFAEDKWTITGESAEGPLEIYEMAGGAIRFVFPISIPSFVTEDVLVKIVETLQPTIEGLVGMAHNPETGDLMLQYYMHITIDSNSVHLDDGLIKFLEERKIIRDGFNSLEKEYHKMQDAMAPLMEGLNQLSKQMGRPESRKGAPPASQDNSGGLSNLWDDMDKIDKKKDEDDLPPTEPSA